MGPGMMGYRGERNGNWGNLSREDAAKMGTEQAAFLKATEKIRQNIYAKGLELRSELSPSPEGMMPCQRPLQGWIGVGHALRLFIPGSVNRNRKEDEP